MNYIKIKLKTLKNVENSPKVSQIQLKIWTRPEIQNYQLKSSNLKSESRIMVPNQKLKLKKII